MDLTPLRTFVTVGDEGHLTRAAERLHISQPAASGHIRALERNLDVVLFDRTNRGLELTTTGQLLMSKARKLLAEAQAFTAAARALSGHAGGVLTVGSNSDPALSRIASVVEDMQTRHPTIQLLIRSRSSASALQSVRSGELDAAFLLGPGFDESLSSLLLQQVHFRVAGPYAWREQLERADRESLAQLPWITAPAGNSYSRMMQTLLVDKGLQVNSAVEADNATMILALISAGVGISLVREDFARKAQRARQMAVWPFERVSTQLMFVFARNREEDPLILAFLDSIRRVWSIQEEDAAYSPLK